MRHLAVLCLVAIASTHLHAGASLKEARDNLLRGNYAEARVQYASLARAGPDGVAATLGVSQAHEYLGDYEKALESVDLRLKDASKDADLLARRAELLHLRGQWDDAEKAARAAVEAKDDCYLAHWVLGQVLRDRGEGEKADEEFRWFVRTYDSDKKYAPEELLVIGLAALERARVHHLADQFEFVLNDVFKEALKLDKRIWPGDLEAGRLFLEKHNKRDAYKAFDRALLINPRAAEVLVGKGQLAMLGFEMQDAEQFAEQALKINPNLASALRLRSDVYWFAGDTDTTMKDLDNARAFNPRDEETLGRIAACLQAQKKDKEFQALIGDVEKHNARPHIFYEVLAQRLEERKHYDRAEKYYQKAVALRPELPDGLSGLGMLYLRQGREAEAHKTLDQAFDADSFNIRVSNSLKVLDHLEKYETLKTEHFHLRYDKKNDAVLSAYMAKYLEEIYAELAGRFDYRPAGPILIEVFNRHEMFSGRVVALPDLHTIGACTGRVVAMVSTHDKSGIVGKPFNWVRVIRHELVHVFNLEQTQFQIPHWFTEGLAVTYEGSTTPPSWHYLLAEKVRAGDLLNLDNILLGFVRPRSPLQWQQAYLQSQLYVEYLVKTHGPKSVGKLLAAFAEGLDTGPALEKACAVTKTDFEKGYRAFLDERVKEIAIPAAAKTKTRKALEDARAKNPADVDATAQLAERYYQFGKKANARALVDEALAAQPRHTLALYVKALLAIDARDQETAYSILDSAVTDASTDVKPIKLLGKIQFDAKKYALAAHTFERGRKLEPHDVYWLEQLAKAYLRSEQDEKLMEVYKELTRAKYDDPIPRKALARHALRARNHAEAEQYARQALEIDVLDTEVQDVMLEALQVQGKQEEAQVMRKIFGR